jgi:hypothetical protein
MTDWRMMAAALSPPIPAEDIEKIVPVLEALEAAFAPMALSIPRGSDVWATDVWNGAE